jgi:hypothetical protein
LSSVRSAIPRARSDEERTQLQTAADAIAGKLTEGRTAADNAVMSAKRTEANQAFEPVRALVEELLQTKQVDFASIADAGDLVNAAADDGVTVKIACAVRRPDAATPDKATKGDADDLFELTATVTGPAEVIQTYELAWSFGDGSTTTLRPVTVVADGASATQTVAHRFRSAGDFTVAVSNKAGQSKTSIKVEVIGGGGRYARLNAAFRLTTGRMTLIAGALAVGSGFLTLYFADGDWGSPKDYLNALLWGTVVSEGIKLVADLVDRVLPAPPKKADA